MDGDFAVEIIGDIDLNGDALTNSEIQTLWGELGDCRAWRGQECDEDQQRVESACGVHIEESIRELSARRTLRGSYCI